MASRGLSNTAALCMTQVGQHREGGEVMATAKKKTAAKKTAAKKAPAKKKTPKKMK
jgi:topoisomerase IA-like protein